MANTPPRRLMKVSRAFTSIAAVGVLVASGLTYSAIEAPAPVTAEPCIPGSSPTCGPGPGPGPTTDVPTGPATTAPQAPTTTPPGAQQPTESPSDPTPNQGGNGMNVQTPNQPTTNPNGIFGQTQSPAPTGQQPTQQTPTTAEAPPSEPQQATTSDQQNAKECSPFPFSEETILERVHGGVGRIPVIILDPAGDIPCHCADEPVVSNNTIDRRIQPDPKQDEKCHSYDRTVPFNDMNNAYGRASSKVGSLLSANTKIKFKIKYCTGTSPDGTPYITKIEGETEGTDAGIIKFDEGSGPKTLSGENIQTDLAYRPQTVVFEVNVKNCVLLQPFCVHDQKTTVKAKLTPNGVEWGNFEDA